MKYFISFLWSCVSFIYADTWSYPQVEDYYSVNKNYLLRVTPPNNKKENQGCLGEFFQISTSGNRSLWKGNLSNKIAPVTVKVCDNGKNFLTLNNWNNVGYGDDVAVFYNLNGIVKKYSLEEILRFIETNEKEANYKRFENYFSHTTSSRWWLQDSYMTLVNFNDLNYFCIWLGWCDTWVVWNVIDGKKIKPSESLEEMLNESLRTFVENASVEYFNLGAVDWNVSVAMKYFTYNKQVGDSKVLTKMFLKAKGFKLVDATKTVDNQKYFKFSFTSKTRKMIDKKLWPLGVDRGLIEYKNKTKRLGSLFGEIKDESTWKFLHIFLFSKKYDSILKDEMSYTEHFVIENQVYFFSRFSGNIKDKSRMFFELHDLLPGKYQIKILKSNTVEIPKFSDFSNKIYELLPGKVLDIPNVFILD